MALTTRPLVAGNWKMNGTSESLIELRAIAAGLNSDRGLNFDALICLPATLIAHAFDALENEKLALGGQDCHYAVSGAYTGDVSAAMLKDAGASYVIVGHSERRVEHHESNALIQAKVLAAWQAGLIAIVCVGEPLDIRENSQTLEFVGEQLRQSLPDDFRADKTVIAYEPIWAIGSGKTPSVNDVYEVHQFMRNELSARFTSDVSAVRLLYGGSVKPANAKSLLSVENVNGALVGGASLKAADFLSICDAYRKI